jgi:hypothetical protein
MDYLTLFQLFASHFSESVWQQARVLLLGAILCRGQRTVCAVLRVMGLDQEALFEKYHRVLNRAAWSSWALSRTLLTVLIQVFVPTGPVICGLDDTIERRRGDHIKAKGIYRDPVRSSQSHFVKASGLRWLSLMLLAPITWAGQTWALPFMTCLAPSERYYAHRVRGHKKLTDWGRQMIRQLRRWLPGQSLVIVADSSFAAISWLSELANLPDLCLIVRFRLDAGLYAPAPKRKPGQPGRPRKKGKRLPTLATIAAARPTRWQRIIVSQWYGEGRRMLEIVSDTAVWYHGGQPPLPIRWVLIRDPKGVFKTQALLSTDLNLKPKQILQWFILRWRLEVTFREAREHLGMETQRQWSDKAILRTTPALLALFSLVTLIAHQHAKRRKKFPMRQTAWYHKPQPTFSDALALVRAQIWTQEVFPTCASASDGQKPLGELPSRLFSALC